MRVTKTALGAFLLSILVSATVYTSQAQSADSAFNDFINLSAGESQQREFEVNGIFELEKLNYIEAFVVLLNGDAQELTIEVTADLDAATAPILNEPDEDEDDEDEEMDEELRPIIDFTLIGFGFVQRKGLKIIYKGRSEPDSLEAIVPIESNLGFLVIGVIVEQIEDAEFPVPCTIRFSLSEAEEI